MSAEEREKIAVIGGGPSAMTAVYWLTSTPELRDRYEITVYQMGWRLGGKGASGRNQAHHDRIEEHGLHIMFGFYQNFFSMIRKVYAEVDRPPGAPLATWREAFHPLSGGIMEDWFDGRWRPWYQIFPRNREVPGQGSALNGAFDYLTMGLQAVFGLLFGWRAQQKLGERFFPSGAAWERGRDDHPPEGTDTVRWVIRVLDAVLRLASWVDHRLPWLVKVVEKIRAGLWRAVLPAVRRSATAHRLWTGVDFLWSAGAGMVHDRLFYHGNFAHIDDQDFREWLQHHGAHEETAWSPWTRAIYDAAFSYDDGRSTEERISASVALRTLVRMLMSYKSAMYFKMQSGMGDTIFGPLYQALKDRGVTFKFFHKVSAIHLDADGASVARIDVQQQADLVSGDPTSYEPLFDAEGLPSWPSEPLWKQVRDADKLKGIDLESYYSGYDGVRTLTLEAGADFDTVLLATPVQTLPFLCADMERWNEKWRTMAQEVKAVQTLSFQTWFSRDLRDLGWTGPSSPLLSLYVQPYNTWSDMSQVLPREAWPPSERPLNVSYFTGAQPGPDEPPPTTDHDFPVRMTADARARALAFLKENATTLLTEAMDPANPPEIDWSLLVGAPPGTVGEARFASQYWRSNCDPHERCTLALPGTGKHRLPAGGTGYRNLVIAGDWIDNGIHVACLEGAVMGGIFAARAVSGIEFPIIGEMLNGDIFGTGRPDPLRETDGTD